MTWTADKPTVPGYYWHRHDNNPRPQPMRVVKVEGLLYVFWIGSGAMTTLHDWNQLGSQWAGPILPPNEVPT